MEDYKQFQTEEQIQNCLDECGGIALIYFHASWCGPCRFISPYVKQTAQKNGIVLIKVDVDECEELTTLYGVSAMPTYIVVQGKAKNKVCRMMGGSKAKVDEVIQVLKNKKLKTK